ncbi:MAG TPA: glycosyltransferase [Acidobacteriota bacterium]|jgi:processive 1,2-diacylglycerol beta-glucosyltransferase
MQKKLLILYLSCGAGHGQAARALHEAASRDATWTDIRRLDVARFYSPWFRWIYHQSYLNLIRHAPGIADRMWKDEPRCNGQDVWTFPPAVIRRGARAFSEFLQRFKPSAVISTEIAACELLALFPQRRNRDITSTASIIDFRFIDPVWLNKKIDTYCVPTLWERDRLLQMGVPGRSIRVTGIPVLQQFMTADKQSARRALGAPAKRFIVLFMAGGMSGNLLKPALRNSLASVDALHVVLAGSVAGDTRRLRRLEHTNLLVLGWTDEVARWMAAADLIVTKPGGMTLAESMIVGRPLVLLRPLGCWERANMRFAVEAGAAIAVASDRELAQVISGLLANPARLQGLSSAGRSLLPADAARQIVALASSEEHYAMAQ